MPTLPGVEDPAGQAEGDDDGGSGDGDGGSGNVDCVAQTTRE